MFTVTHKTVWCLLLDKSSSLNSKELYMYFKWNVGKKVSGKKVSGKKVSEKKNPEKKYQEKK